MLSSASLPLVRQATVALTIALLGLSTAGCAPADGPEAVTCGEYLDYSVKEKRSFLRDIAKTDALDEETKKQFEESGDEVLDLVAATLDGACEEAGADER